MVKYTQTIRRLLSTSCLSVFDHFVGLALKGLFDFLYDILRDLHSLKNVKNTHGGVLL